MKRAGALRLARDAVSLDQIPHEAGGCAERVEQALAMPLPQDLGHVVRHDPEAGIDQPDIAARTAEADLHGLEHDNLPAGLGHMQGGRKPGESRPDHDHIGLDRSRKACVLGAGGAVRSHRPWERGSFCMRVFCRT